MHKFSTGFEQKKVGFKSRRGRNPRVRLDPRQIRFRRHSEEDAPSSPAGKFYFDERAGSNTPIRKIGTGYLFPISSVHSGAYKTTVPGAGLRGRGHLGDFSGNSGDAGTKAVPMPVLRLRVRAALLANDSGQDRGAALREAVPLRALPEALLRDALGICQRRRGAKRSVARDSRFKEPARSCEAS